MNKPSPARIEAKFWARVAKSDGCWEWQGARANGYGTLIVNGQHTTASRYSWALQNGPIPAGLFVCHTCDNPPCVRPDHLFIGTQSDNMSDAARKGRMGKKPIPATHCQRGHEFTEANTSRTPNGRRRCRRCMSDHLRAWRREHPDIVREQQARYRQSATSAPRP